MSMNIDFKWLKPIPAIMKETTGGDATLMFMATEWHRLYKPFVPMQSGALSADSVSYSVVSGKGVITHSTPYARRQYYGTHHKFTKPLAQAHWDEGAKNAGKGKALARAVEAYIKRG